MKIEIIKINWLHLCLVILLVIGVFVSSCKNGAIEKVPDDIISPKEMEAILWDNVNAEVLFSNHTKNSMSKNDTLELARLQGVILGHHHIDKKKYDKSYAFYVANPDLMVGIIDSILNNKHILMFGDTSNRLD